MAYHAAHTCLKYEIQLFACDSLRIRKHWCETDSVYTGWDIDSAQIAQSRINIKQINITIAAFSGRDARTAHHQRQLHTVLIQVLLTVCLAANQDCYLAAAETKGRLHHPLQNVEHSVSWTVER